MASQVTLKLRTQIFKIFYFNYESIFYYRQKKLNAEAKNV